MRPRGGADRSGLVDAFAAEAGGGLMAAGATASRTGGKLFGVAGVLMALCCIAGPAVLGAAAGAAIGSWIGVAAAILVAVGGVLLGWRWRSGRDGAC